MYLMGASANSSNFKTKRSCGNAALLLMSEEFMNVEISIVVPVYNATDCLNELYRRLKQTLDLLLVSWEIVLVDDCSQDSSWEMIKAISAIDGRVKGLRFSRNFGQHHGITAGLDSSCGNWVVVMDCDLQDPPEAILDLYRKAQEGFEVVLAARSLRQDSILKKTTSKLFFFFFNRLTSLNYDGRVANFRIISKRVVEEFKRLGEQLRFFGGVIEWLGFPSATVEVQHEARYAGKSSYNFKRMFRLASHIIIAYSDKPLKLSVFAGFVISSVAFLIGLWEVFRALTSGIPVLGWASLFSSLYFLGGIIILNLGVIGLYLGKTFDETKKRPLYVIRDRVGRIQN